MNIVEGRFTTIVEEYDEYLTVITTWQCNHDDGILHCHHVMLSQSRDLPSIDEAVQLRVGGSIAAHALTLHQKAVASQFEIVIRTMRTSKVQR